jgi:hypothetical protein
MFRDKFWISLALTVPTLIWGHMAVNSLRPMNRGWHHGRRSIHAFNGILMAVAGSEITLMDRPCP